MNELKTYLVVLELPSFVVGKDAQEKVEVEAHFWLMNERGHIEFQRYHDGVSEVVYLANEKNWVSVERIG